MKHLHLTRKHLKLLASPLTIIFLISSNALAFPVLLAALILIPLLAAPAGVQIMKLVGSVANFMIKVSANWIVEWLELLYGPAMRLAFNYMEDGILYNPTIYPFTCPAIGAIPYGCAVENLILMMFKILAPVYVMLLLMIGIYLIFVAVEPQSRARAKSELNKLLISMLVVSSSPIIYQFLLDLSRLMSELIFSHTTTATSEAMSKGVIIAFSNPITLLMGSTIVLLGLILILARIFFVIVFAILFPVSLFLYFFDFTKGLGGNMLRATMLFIFLQVIQAMIFVITGLTAAEQSNSVLRGFIVMAGMAGMVFGGMLMAGVMKWVGGFAQMAGTAAVGRGHMSGAFMAGVGGVMMGQGSGGLVQAGTTAGYMGAGSHTGQTNIGRRFMKTAAGAAGFQGNVKDAYREGGGGVRGVVKGFKQWGRNYAGGYRNRRDGTIFTRSYNKIHEPFKKEQMRGENLPTPADVSKARRQAAGGAVNAGAGPAPAQMPVKPEKTPAVHTVRSTPHEQAWYPTGTPLPSMTVNRTQDGQASTKAKLSELPEMALKDSGFLPTMLPWFFPKNIIDGDKSDRSRSGKSGRWGHGRSLMAGGNQMRAEGKKLWEESKELSGDARLKKQKNAKKLVRRGRRKNLRGVVSCGSSILTPISFFHPVQELGVVITGLGYMLPKDLNIGMPLQIGAFGLSLGTRSASLAAKGMAFGLSMGSKQDTDKLQAKLEKWNARADKADRMTEGLAGGGKWIHRRVRIPIRGSVERVGRVLSSFSFRELAWRRKMDAKTSKAWSKYKEAIKGTDGKPDDTLRNSSEAQRKKEKLFDVLRESAEGHPIYGSDPYHHDVLLTRLANGDKNLWDDYIKDGGDRSGLETQITKHKDITKTLDNQSIGLRPAAEGDRGAFTEADRDAFEKLLKDESVDKKVFDAYIDEHAEDVRRGTKSKMDTQTILQGLNLSDDVKEKLGGNLGAYAQYRSARHNWWYDHDQLIRSGSESYKKKFLASIVPEDRKGIEASITKEYGVGESWGKTQKTAELRKGGKPKSVWEKGKSQDITYNSLAKSPEGNSTLKDINEGLKKGKSEGYMWDALDAEQKKSVGNDRTTFGGIVSEANFRLNNIDWNRGTVSNLIELSPEEAAVALHNEWNHDLATGEMRRNYKMERSSDNSRLYLKKDDYLLMKKIVDYEGGEIRSMEVKTTSLDFTSVTYLQKRETKDGRWEVRGRDGQGSAEILDTVEEADARLKSDDRYIMFQRQADDSLEMVRDDEGKAKIHRTPEEFKDYVRKKVQLYHYTENEGAADAREVVLNRETGRVQYFASRDDADYYMQNGKGVWVVGGGIADERIGDVGSKGVEAAATTRAEQLRDVRNNGAYFSVDDVEGLKGRYGFTGKQVNKLVEEWSDVRSQFGTNAPHRVRFEYDQDNVNPMTTDALGSVTINIGSKLFALDDVGKGGTAWEQLKGSDDGHSEAYIETLSGSMDGGGWNSKPIYTDPKILEKNPELVGRSQLVTQYKSTPAGQAKIEKVQENAASIDETLDDEAACRVIYNKEGGHVIDDAEAAHIYNMRHALETGDTKQFRSKMSIINHEVGHILLHTGASGGPGKHIETQQQMAEWVVQPKLGRVKKAGLRAWRYINGEDAKPRGLENLGKHAYLEGMDKASENVTKKVGEVKAGISSDMLGNILSEVGATKTAMLRFDQPDMSQGDADFVEQEGRLLKTGLDIVNDELTALKQSGRRKVLNDDQVGRLASYAVQAELIRGEGDDTLIREINDFAKQYATGGRKKTFEDLKAVARTFHTPLTWKTKKEEDG